MDSLYSNIHNNLYVDRISKSIFDSVQFSFICIAILKMDKVTKQLYRNILINATEKHSPYHPEIVSWNPQLPRAQESKTAHALTEGGVAYSVLCQSQATLTNHGCLWAHAHGGGQISHSSVLLNHWCCLHSSSEKSVWRKNTRAFALIVGSCHVIEESCPVGGNWSWLS